MNLLIHKDLFTAWCGLLLSGYSLTDPKDKAAGEVLAALPAVPVPSKIRAYFSLARTDRVEVNPWYPRGSELSAACLMLSGGWEAYRAFLISCGSPSVHDQEFWNWIVRLPELLEAIQQLPGFEKTWRPYESQVTARFQELPPKIDSLQARLDRYGWPGTPRLCFVPNLLQAPSLADFAVSGGTLYVVSGCFSPSVMVHEAMHLILHGSRPAILKALRQFGLAQFADWEKLSALGYLHGQSESSQAHALEECLARALTGWICGEGEEYCRQNRESGFTAVPDMMERLSSLPPCGLEPLIAVCTGSRARESCTLI